MVSGLKVELGSAATTTTGRAAWSGIDYDADRFSYDGSRRKLSYGYDGANRLVG
jgi:hypothetical protein